MKPKTLDTLISPPLVAEIQAAATEEQRPVSEIVDEAVATWLRQRRLQKIYAAAEKRAKEMGLAEQDVPRLIAEYRQESRQEG